MGFLENFERQVERLVGGAFAKTFTSGVHPVEIVAALKKEIDTCATVVSRSRVVAPHTFRISLSTPDFDRFTRLGPDFVAELRSTLDAYAKQRGYSFSEPLQITLAAQTNLIEGVVEVSSEKVRKVVWIPSITWKGTVYPLVRSHTLIGRGSDADVHVDAKGVSRHHAEIHWDGKKAEIIDLGSTNGTQVEGKKIDRAALPDACTLTIGQARILFQMVPQAPSAYQSLAQSLPVDAEETS